MTQALSDIHEIPKPELADNYVVAALYKFVVLSDLAEWQEKIRAICSDTEMMGTLLIATEGLNGTISAAYEDMIQFVSWLRGHDEFSDIAIKYAIDRMDHIAIDIKCICKNCCGVLNSLSVS